MSKYGAQKTTVDGITFASKSEATRDGELQLELRAGLISNLVRQPKFILQPAFRHQGEHVPAITYTADWEYDEDGQHVIEDRKGMETDVFKLKWKLMKAKYPHYIFRITHR